MRVRVETEGEAYVGTLCGARTLAEVLDDGRAYLALRDAVVQDSSRIEEFVAIHKGSIRTVAIEPEAESPDPDRCPS